MIAPSAGALKRASPVLLLAALLSWMRYVLGMPVLRRLWASRRPAATPRPLRPGRLLMLGSTTPSGFLATLIHVVAGGIVVVLGTPGRPAGGLSLEGGEILPVAAHLSALTSSMISGELAVVCGLVWSIIDIDLPTQLPMAMVWGTFLWIGVLSVAAAVLLWNTDVAMVGIPVASLFPNSAPVRAIALAALMGRKPSWLRLAGGALVLRGIAILQAGQIRAAHR